MRTKTQWLGLGGLLWMAHCNTFAGIDHGTPRDFESCFTLADCHPEVPECRTMLACTEGRCVFEDAPEGTALAAQQSGDCVETVCDGAGRTKPLAAVTDVPYDGDPCTSDECDGTTPRHIVRTELSCYTGPKWTNGVGRCAPGIQHCAGGSPTSGCEGEVLPAEEICDGTLSDENCDGQVNEKGEGCACFPGGITPCYTGPAGTEGIGICHAGVHGCEAGGLGYGQCFEEQLPEPENCDALSVDEDCDGEVNEAGPDCSCGDGDLSSGEGCDDGNTLDGDGCLSSCQPAIVDMAAGSAHYCVVIHDGRVKCWGLNISGRLGLGDTNSRGDGPGEMGSALPAVNLGIKMKAVAIGAGIGHTCALLDNGTIKCWGYNDNGQLGLGDTQSRGDEPSEMGAALPAVDLGTGKTALAISAGFAHTCALLDGGMVKCWGRNFLGALGLGDGNDRGDFPGEMGDALPTVNLGTGRTALAIRAGAYHTCALLDDNTLKCWGINEYAALGLGDTMSRGGLPGQMGDALPAVDLGTGAKAIAFAAGNRDSCALLEDGSIKCWGYNDHGQLGLGDTMNRGDGPGEMGAALPAVDLGGQIPGTQNKKATAIAARAHHTCALLQDGRLKCWGDNGYGQLGLGDAQNRGDNPGEMGDALFAVLLGSETRVIAVAPGDEHSCALLHDGMLKCWGGNHHGELGLGDTQNRGDNPGEMGDSLPAVML